MTRQHKKRHKQYHGSVATNNTPVVHKYTAVVRSPAGEWWVAHKKQVRTVALLVAGVLVFGYLLFEFVRLLF